MQVKPCACRVESEGAPVQASKWQRPVGGPYALSRDLLQHCTVRYRSGTPLSGLVTVRTVQSTSAFAEKRKLFGASRRGTVRQVNWFSLGGKTKRSQGTTPTPTTTTTRHHQQRQLQLQRLQQQRHQRLSSKINHRPETASRTKRGVVLLNHKQQQQQQHGMHTVCRLNRDTHTKNKQSTKKIKIKLNYIIFRFPGRTDRLKPTRCNADPFCCCCASQQGLVGWL